MKIAACQLPEIRRDVDRALAVMERYLAVADSQHVELVCLPECYLQGYLCDAVSAKDQAISLNSGAFDTLLNRLSRFQCVFVFGFIEDQNGLLFNSAAVVHHGNLIGCYRKTHLLRGEAVFEPGVAYPTFLVKDFQFGINICYDTNFPEVAAALAERGARLILCPANNMLPLENAEKWKTLHNEIRAQRAKETGCWLLSSDVTGTRENQISFGPTAVIDPDGRVLTQVPLLQEGMVVAEIGTCLVNGPVDRSVFRSPEVHSL